MARMSTKQRQKFKELKSKLEEAMDELKVKLKERKECGEEVPEELKEEIVSLQGVTSALADEASMAKRNRLGSSHYEFNPTGSNRQQRRIYGDPGRIQKLRK